MKFLYEMNFSSPIIFVGGAMRSGTTLLNALLCTSQKTNGFLAECRYFTTLISPLESAQKLFDFYSKYYFSDQQELQEYHALLLLKVLSDIRANAGSPEILVLKDPFITQFIPFLVSIHSLIRGAIIFRDYRECIASVVRGEEKDGSVVSDQQFIDICNQYCQFYKKIISDAPLIQEKFVLLRYDDLVHGKGIDLLKRVGVDDVDPEKLWNGSITDVSDYEGYKYYSDLYGKPLSAERVGDPRATFSGERDEIARKICGQTFDDLNRMYEAQSAIG